MSTLEEWTAAVRAGLGLGQGPLSTADSKAVLDLARDVAHAVDRPAAPLTAFLLGVAVCRGLTLPDASGHVRALAAAWGASEENEEDEALPDSYRAAVSSRAGPRSRYT